MDFRHRVEGLVDDQYRHPRGIIGRAIGEVMLRQHVVETQWTISLLELAPADRVLEIGCGAGRAVELIAQRTLDGHVTGVDLSRQMVRAAGRRNARAIGEGRATLRQGDVTSLPFADRQFDKILSIHSLYFWPDHGRAMAELARVLKPGGWLALTFSTGKVGAADAGYRAIVEEHILPAMTQAGFTTASIVEGPVSRRFKIAALVAATSSITDTSRKDFHLDLLAWAAEALTHYLAAPSPSDDRGTDRER